MAKRLLYFLTAKMKVALPDVTTKGHRLIGVKSAFFVKLINSLIGLN